jgi:hypothetical protein
MSTCMDLGYIEILSDSQVDEYGHVLMEGMQDPAEQSILVVCVRKVAAQDIGLSELGEYSRGCYRRNLLELELDNKSNSEN